MTKYLLLAQYDESANRERTITSDDRLEMIGTVYAAGDEPTNEELAATIKEAGLKTDEEKGEFLLVPLVAEKRLWITTSTTVTVDGARETAAV